MSIVLDGTTGVTTPGLSSTSNATVTGTLAVTGVSTLTGGIAVQAWVAPTLANGWANLGGGYTSVGYFKDSEGAVHIKGVISGGTQTAGTNLFTLPVGYRPTAHSFYPVSDNAGAAASVVVRSDGAVNISYSVNGLISFGELVVSTQ